MFIYDHSLLISGAAIDYADEKKFKDHVKKHLHYAQY